MSLAETGTVSRGYNVDAMLTLLALPCCCYLQLPIKDSAPWWVATAAMVRARLESPTASRRQSNSVTSTVARSISGSKLLPPNALPSAAAVCRHRRSLASRRQTVWWCHRISASAYDQRRVWHATRIHARATVGSLRTGPVALPYAAVAFKRERCDAATSSPTHRFTMHMLMSMPVSASTPDLPCPLRRPPVQHQRIRAMEETTLHRAECAVASAMPLRSSASASLVSPACTATRKFARLRVCKRRVRSSALEECRSALLCPSADGA